MSPRPHAGGLLLPGVEPDPAPARSRRPETLVQLALAVLAAGALVAGLALPVLSGVARGPTTSTTC
ncbi:hypothetical protein [Blastococcus brunescens]|uniref:Uncharacterized protein n=1 Tax=Blastococcus brunescens TaxID=1564165 RepID=A0ABZ1B5T5_9ACTN|nr:hypothetical protein [Blastococcus sp. BMG 8361]WRL64375.1 hypothetical protein U6N30_00460 [Blastococcus sp. BMG 8361]